MRRANEQLRDHLDAQAKGVTRRINPDRPGGETRQKADGPHNPQGDEDETPAAKQGVAQSEVASHEVASSSTSELTRLHLTRKQASSNGSSVRHVMYLGACPMRQDFEGLDGGSDIHLHVSPCRALESRPGSGTRAGIAQAQTQARKDPSFRLFNQAFLGFLFEGSAVTTTPLTNRGCVSSHRPLLCTYVCMYGARDGVC